MTTTKDRADALGYVGVNIPSRLRDSRTAKAATGAHSDLRAALIHAADVYAAAEDERVDSYKRHGQGPVHVAAVAASDKAAKRAPAALAAFLAGRPDTHNLGGYLHVKGFEQKLEEVERLMAQERVRAEHAVEIAVLQKAIALLPIVQDLMSFTVGTYVLPVGQWYGSDAPRFGVVDKITHGGKRVMALGLVPGQKAGDLFQLRPGKGSSMGMGVQGYKALPEGVASEYLRLATLIATASAEPVLVPAPAPAPVSTPAPEKTAAPLTLPPGVPAKDLTALSIYIRDSLNAGRYGLPDIFEAEKLGVDPKAYAKHAREVWWPALLSRFKGHARDRDLEAVMRDYQVLNTVYGNVLAYTGTRTHDIHHPEVEYKQAIGDAARAPAPRWWGAAFSDFGYPLVDPKGTAQRLLEEGLKNPSNTGWSSYVELARLGLPPMKVFARVWIFIKEVDGYPQMIFGISVYLYTESMDYIVPNTIRPDLQHVQERHNDGPNAYFVGGAPAYALPLLSIQAPALAVVLINRNRYAGGDTVDILKRKGWAETKTGKPKDGRKTYKLEAPGYGSSLAWVSSQDDAGFRVLNPPILDTTKGKTK